MNCRRSSTIERSQRREPLEFNTRLSSKTWRWVRIIFGHSHVLSALIPWDVLANIAPHWSHLLRLNVLKCSPSANAVSRCSLCKWTGTYYFHARQWVISVNEHNRPPHSGRGKQLWRCLQTHPPPGKDSKYEKLFKSVFFGARKQTCQKCWKATGYRLQELILKMKQNTGRRFTPGFISSTCVRSFNGCEIETGWHSSCFITSQSL